MTFSPEDLNQGVPPPPIQADDQELESRVEPLKLHELLTELDDLADQCFENARLFAEVDDLQGFQVEYKKHLKSIIERAQQILDEYENNEAKYTVKFSPEGYREAVEKKRGTIFAHQERIVLLEQDPYTVMKMVGFRRHPHASE